MKKARLDARLFKAGRCLHLLGCLLAAFLLMGCRAIPPLPPAVQDLGPIYHPGNVYRRSDSLSFQIRRVALLPLTATSSAGDLDAGIDILEPILYSELEKTRRFEVIPVTRSQMKQWTGRNSWRSDEQLPPDLMSRIVESTGCDAIIFCQLTRYQAYQPLAVGWKFSLVETPQPSESPVGGKTQILWAADELFDAGDPAVTTGARVYYSQHLRNDAASSDPSIMLNSPTRFGQYTLGTLLSTLPERPLLIR